MCARGGHNEAWWLTGEGGLIQDSRAGSSIKLGAANTKHAHSPMAAAGEVHGETVATRSLDDSSLPVNFHGNLASAQNDEELLTLLQRAKTSKKPAVVTYGAPWCHACRHMLPTFCNLSNDYASALFIYADVDKCHETTRDVRYTPTFRFYRDGEKVDEFYGAGPQRLRDRVWLQSES